MRATLNRAVLFLRWLLDPGWSQMYWTDTQTSLYRRRLLPQGFEFQIVDVQHWVRVPSVTVIDGGR